MKLALISPPEEHPDELRLLEAMFQAGLSRYDLRKPDWSQARIAAWLEALPACWHGQVWLHSHHALASSFQIGGVHYQDRPGALDQAPEGDGAALPRSRACHNPLSLRSCLGAYDAVLFSPVFPSVSKLGYGSMPSPALDEASCLLGARSAAARKTSVYALSGISPERVPTCHRLGFDGVAAIGTVWNTAEPLPAFRSLLVATQSIRVETTHP